MGLEIGMSPLGVSPPLQECPPLPGGKNIR